MRRDDQRIVSTLIDILHTSETRKDVGHRGRVRQQLRAALDSVRAFEAAHASALRRGRELQRRDEPKAEKGGA